MPRRKIQLVNGEFYHIVKRGTEEREIFLDHEDRFRFINGLLVFNDKLPTPWQSRGFWHQRNPATLCRSDYSPKIPLVAIHTFALMSNHFHLLLSQLVEGGIEIFMQKIGGYSRYFNKKYERSGTLFQDRYKIVHITTQQQIKNSFVYIHTNPVALIEPEWKNWKVKNPQKTIQFLEEEYLWSSYWDYLGRRNFPSVIQKDFFLKMFGNEKEIKKEIDSWVSFKASTGLDLDKVEFE